MPTPSSQSWQPELLLGLKLFLLSTGLAVGIRTLGPNWPLPATPAIVWTIVLFPTLCMAGLFSLRWYRR